MDSVCVCLSLQLAEKKEGEGRVQVRFTRGAQESVYALIYCAVLFYIQSHYLLAFVIIIIIIIITNLFTASQLYPASPGPQPVPGFMLTRSLNFQLPAPSLTPDSS